MELIDLAFRREMSGVIIEEFVGDKEKNRMLVKKMKEIWQIVEVAWMPHERPKTSLLPSNL